MIDTFLDQYHDNCIYRKENLGLVLLSFCHPVKTSYLRKALGSLKL